MNCRNILSSFNPIHPNSDSLNDYLRSRKLVGENTNKGGKGRDGLSISTSLLAGEDTAQGWKMVQ